MTHDLILAQVNAALMTVLIVVAPILLVSVVAGAIVGLACGAVAELLDKLLDRAVLDVKAVNLVQRRSAPRISLQDRQKPGNDLLLAGGFFVGRRLRCGAIDPQCKR